MSIARLEIIENVGEPIHVSKTMPAAIEGIICPKEFGFFIEQLDGPLQQMDTESKRSFKQLNQAFGCMFLYVMALPWVLILYYIGVLTGTSVRVFSRLYLVPLTIMVMVACAIRRPSRVRSRMKLFQKMKTHCELMTMSTPRNVSFHVVLLKTPHYNSHNILKVDYIAVNVDLPASATLGSDIDALLSDEEDGHGSAIV